MMKTPRENPCFKYHPKCSKLHLSQLGFAHDFLLFCRLSMVQCRPLIDKMVGRVTSCTTKFLSQAGRLQLIQSVLISIQTFWSQIFVLPKKVIQMLEVVLRRYLWTGKAVMSREALLAWEKVCYPKTAGGFNVTDIATWNRVVICKLLWNLCRKEDRLWIQWIHCYYNKQGSIWNMSINQASWMIKKIIKAQRYLEEVEITEQQLIQTEHL